MINFNTTVQAVKPKEEEKSNAQAILDASSAVKVGYKSVGRDQVGVSLD